MRSRLSPVVLYLLGAGLLLFPAGVLRAQDSGVASTECCVPLLMPAGARVVGLAGALTARAGADGFFINPASLAELGSDEFRVHSARTEFETTTTFVLSMRIRSAGTIGVAYRLIDSGDTELFDDQQNPTGTLALLEHVLQATFATTMSDELRAGISYKLFRYLSASTHGLDAGVQFHPKLWPALQLGVSVVHLGFPLQVVNAEQADPMPARLRAGVAYEVMHHFSPDSTTAVWATADVAASWREGIPPVASGGLELILDETVFVRTGYSTGTGRTAGAAVGMGLRYDRFDVGVAKTFAPVSGTGGDFQVTFAITF